MSIYDKLFNYQKSIIDNYCDRKHFGVFLDMGLGKTPICLSFAERNKCNKTLIITINSKALEDEDVDGSWLCWAKQSDCKYDNYYCKSNLPKIIKKNGSNIFKDNENDVMVLNYEWIHEKSKAEVYDRKKKKTVHPSVIREVVKEFVKSAKNHNMCIILDESHKVKSSTTTATKITKDIISLCESWCKSTYLYLATGTPFTSDLTDVYTQLTMLGWKHTKKEFEEKFCIMSQNPKLLPWQQYPVGYRNVDLLYKLIHTFGITMKTELAIPLPETVFVYHSLKETKDFKLISREKLKGVEILKELNSRGVTDEMLEEYDMCLDDFNTKSAIPNPFYANIAFPSDWCYADTTITKRMRCRQMSIGFQGNAEEFVWYDKSRLAQLEEFLTNNEDNYILFYSYVPELLEIYDICERLGYNIDVYCGDVKSMRYYEKYSKQTDGERLANRKNIVIGNWTSMSTGLNLQNYNKCIIFDLPAFADWQQGIKRINRVGQKETCVYHIFTQDNFIESGMKKAIDENVEYDDKMFASDLSAINLMKNNK